MRFLLPLLLVAPLTGCGTFETFSERVQAIQAESETELETIDESYTLGEITWDERSEQIKVVLQDAQAELDAAAREAGESVLGTGNAILDLLLALLFGGASGTGALALARRVRGPRAD